MTSLWVVAASLAAVPLGAHSAHGPLAHLLDEMLPFPEA
jgi:hypothetical protein